MGKINLFEREIMKELLLIVIGLAVLLGLMGCRMVDGGVQDTYHLIGLLGDQTSARREKIERKDIMAEQDRLNRRYDQFKHSYVAE